ncbi:MAG: UDP-N-acetylmuramoyl-L-alanyl-D-glutamate--2,6-diaminopimelate ligase [Clostridia bacterium]|nr:UDP-N-acetylmuramoyl-L-alanyl-D-glutamate--2,6-diaminopimelate ligase [Clostridia bacterium]
MKLKELIKDTSVKKVIGNIENIDIENLDISSKNIKKNTLFIAQKGLNVDGHNFAGEAVKNGAVALAVEKEITGISVPQIVVDNTRKASGNLASTFYGNPKNKLKFVGITGTNGKTSSTYFLAEFLKQAGKKTAVIGTLGTFFNGLHFDTDLTTPDPLKLHKTLDILRKHGAEYVVMEVSAHAIDLKKVDNINFEVGILTNITQDHLDYFKTMNEYAKTKLDWFKNGNIKFSIINADDKHCLSLINNPNTLSFGLYNPSDVFAINIEKSARNTEFVLDLLHNVMNCKTNLAGEFNVYNVMATATAALCLGVDLKDIEKTMQKLKAPLGRFSVVELENNKTVIVDYAHTPDSLEKVLKTAREICKGKLISVFGCGGNRDVTKRPIMGSISENLADFSIITSDNPRFEEPESIVNQIETGMKNSNHIKVTNRKSAIKKALSMIKPNDMTIISGKGAELYQDIKGTKYPYNDFDEIDKFKKNNFQTLCKE